MAEEWRNHVPSGYEDNVGYGQVSCSCGWDSSGGTGWEQHINAASVDVWARLVREAVEAADNGIGRDGCPFCGMLSKHADDCIAVAFGARTS